MRTKTKVKSKTTKKKSTTKKPVSQNKSPKKMTSRSIDRRSVFQKCNKFASNLMSGVNLILQQHEDLQKYVLWNLFWDCIYTTHSTSFISKHIEEMEKDDDYRHQVKLDCSSYDHIKFVRALNDNPEGELFDYQLCPMNKKRLEDGMRNLIDTGGVAKFQRVLDDLDQSLIRGKY
jgi:hypothetical protein